MHTSQGTAEGKRVDLHPAEIKRGGRARAHAKDWIHPQSCSNGACHNSQRQPLLMLQIWHLSSPASPLLPSCEMDTLSSTLPVERELMWDLTILLLSVVSHCWALYRACHHWFYLGVLRSRCVSLLDGEKKKRKIYIHIFYTCTQKINVPF